MDINSAEQQLNTGLQELMINLFTVREQIQDLMRQEAELEKRVNQQRGALAILEQIDAEKEEEDG